MSQTSEETEAIITGFIDGIRAPYTFATLTTSLSACLVTLLVVMFVFSTSESRRRLIFRLNVVAICFALMLGVLNLFVDASAILRPFNPVPQSLYITTIVFALFPPVFYDSILLTRLLALYPVDRTPLPTLVGVLTFPLCVKCGRLIVLSLYMRDYVNSSPDVASLAAHAEATWFRNPYITSEWTLQMFDNLYSSGFFLLKLHTQSAGVSPVRLVVDSFEFSLPQVGSIGKRIKQIFYISVANFVFPVLFNIGQIVCITTDTSYYSGTVLLLTSSYVSVIGVLCATIWVSGGDYFRRHNPYGTGSSLLSPQRSPGPQRYMFNSDQPIGSCFETGTAIKKPVKLSRTGEDMQDVELHKMDSEKELAPGNYTYTMYPNIEVHVRHDVDRA
ncbi:hypothetical protein ID866_9175 [Astraeus odoratus]|nr:hypothetical protein ID866_9175 [Astraeus odoratus]